MFSKKRAPISLVLGALVAGAFAAGAASPAVAEASDSADSLVEELQQSQMPRLLDEQEVAVLEEAGNLDEDGVIAPQSCDGIKQMIAFVGDFLEYTDFTCSLIGTPEGIKNYSWSVSNNAIGGSVCLKGQGWRDLGTTRYSYFHVGGCTTGSSDFTVDWQNVAGHPVIQYRAATAPIAGVAFQWK